MAEASIEEFSQMLGANAAQSGASEVLNENMEVYFNNSQYQNITTSFFEDLSQNWGFEVPEETNNAASAGSADELEQIINESYAEIEKSANTETDGWFSNLMGDFFTGFETEQKWYFGNESDNDEYNRCSESNVRTY